MHIYFSSGWLFIDLFKDRSSVLRFVFPEVSRLFTPTWAFLLLLFLNFYFSTCFLPLPLPVFPSVVLPLPLNGGHPRDSCFACELPTVI
jgi:hypothetical protein